MDSFKILGQVASNGATPVKLYSVPVTSSASSGSSVTYTRSFDPPTQTLVTSIVVCHAGASASAHDFYLLLFDSSAGEDGSIISLKNYLVYELPISPNTTKVLSLGLTLSARSNSATPSSATLGDSLWIYSGTGVTDLAVTAMGIEVT